VQTDAPTTPATQVRQLLQEPIVFGTLCGLGSAVGYTAANACLRAVVTCDPVWVSFAKAFPTVALFGPILLVRLLQRRETLPDRRQLRVLVVASIICQLLGNVVFQWSLGAVGMALTIPLTLGTMIAGAALLGRLWLREPVTLAMATSMAVLIAAVFVLSSGASRSVPRHAVEATREARVDSLAEPAQMTWVDPRWRVLMGVSAACLAGLAYALLGVAIRVVVTDSTSLWMTTVTVTLTGLITLGLLGSLSPGLSAWRGTSGWEVGLMLAAGVFNALAFLALTKALQLVPVAYVNALNASQAAMGALAGVFFFAEPSSWQLWVGVGLTAIGLLTMRRRKSNGRALPDSATKR
jgi:drug/metabolite transporter (DMT)-like permease